MLPRTSKKDWIPLPHCICSPKRTPYPICRSLIYLELLLNKNVLCKGYTKLRCGASRLHKPQRRRWNATKSRWHSVGATGGLKLIHGLFADVVIEDEQTPQDISELHQDVKMSTKTEGSTLHKILRFRVKRHLMQMRPKLVSGSAGQKCHHWIRGVRKGLCLYLSIKYKCN